MKRTKGSHVRAHFFQLDIFLDYINNIKPRLYLLNCVVGHIFFIIKKNRFIFNLELKSLTTPSLSLKISPNEGIYPLEIFCFFSRENT